MDVIYCVCDICTRNGANAQGSVQSRTVRAQHRRTQKARDIANAKTDLETATLFAALSLTDDAFGTSSRRSDEHFQASPQETEYTNGSNFIEVHPFDEPPRTLHEIWKQVEERRSSFLFPQSIDFIYPPVAPTDMFPGRGDWKTGPVAVRQDVRSTAACLLYITFLVETRHSLGKPDTGDTRVEVEDLCLKIDEELMKLERMRESEWEKLRRLVVDPERLRIPTHAHGGVWYHTDLYYQPLREERPVIVLGLFMVISLNLVHHLVRSGCRFALHLLKGFLELAFKEVLAPDLTPASTALIRRFPLDIQAAKKLFQLEPAITEFVCCPDCFALYPLNVALSDGVDLEGGGQVIRDTGFVADSAQVQRPIDMSWTSELPFENAPIGATLPTGKNIPYPLECVHRETPESPQCGARLVRFSVDEPETEGSGDHLDGGGRGVPRPLRLFCYQSMKAWLSRLIARPGMELTLDEVWERVRRVPSPSTMSDIWDATELREFCGPDSKPFHDNPNREGRYIFSLFVDWFNPLGNKQAGKVVSSGVIFMVCLNLPLSLRYKRENVYLVGLMPGPKAPHLQQVNHFLQILVNELLEFWVPGVFFSKTTMFPEGRLFRCALVPLVCDLGAMKKTAGQASHSATYFCSFCKLKRQDINNTDQSEWPQRCCVEHRLQAHEWKDGMNLKSQKKVFKRAGVRYTPLLELPYWKPTRYVVVEAMHNLFLGLFHRHCRRIFGMDIKGVAEDGLEEVEIEVVTDEDKELGRVALYSEQPTTRLKRLKKLVLQNLFEETLSRFAEKRTKAQLITGLIDYISGISVPDQNSTVDLPVKVKHSAILDKTALSEIQADIAKTTLPSWIGRSPPNIGSPGHGKLSADQWRTLCTVNLPITLIRLWTQPDIVEIRGNMLVNFLDLVTAVLYGTPRQLTQKRIEAYDHFIFKYARGLIETYPDITLVPNQHYALHLATILRRFGPTHSYWAFPFERYIGLLRDINTNRKPSEMEKTFMETYCMGNNLRGLLSTDLLPAPVSQFRSVIDTALGSDSRGSFMSDLVVFGADAEPAIDFDERKQSVLPSSHYRGLLDRILKDSTLNEGVSFVDHDTRYSGQNVVYLNPNGLVLKEVRHRGLRFTHQKAVSGKGDSYVLYKPFPVNPSSPGLAMGRIVSIFVHRRYAKSDDQYKKDQVFVALRRFTSLTSADKAHNPYRQFKHLRMSLIYSTPLETVEVLPISDVVAHFASCPYEHPSINKPCMVTVPLQR